MARQKAVKRELINTGTDKRYARRNADGTFKESDDTGRSRAGSPTACENASSKRQGDRGDR
jgi:hypothetical protein